MNGSNAVERRERKDMRRNMERVFQAAKELFAERGSDVTMEEVARRAGVGVGTIYRRFPSKEHLFAAVSHAACADMHHCLTEAANDERDPISKLRALIIVQYHHSPQYAGLVDLRPGQATEQQGLDLADRQAQLYTTLHTALQQVITEGQRQGTIRQGDPAVLAALCLELLNPRTLQDIQQATGACPEEVTDYVVRFVLGGLGVR